MNGDSSWVERLYSDLLARDLAYLFAGGLFISVIEYTLYAKIFLPQQISLELFGFLSISYFLGVILYQIAASFRFLSIQGIKGYGSELVLIQDLIEKYDKRVINQLERIQFHYRSAVTIGISSFLGGVLMIVFALYRWLFRAILPSEIYSMLIFALVSFGIVHLYVGNRFKRFVERDEKAMIENIQKNS